MFAIACRELSRIAQDALGCGNVVCAALNSSCWNRFPSAETKISTRMDDIAQLKYSLGTEKNLIPVHLPNSNWSKNGTAPKGEWEGRSLSPTE